MNTCRCGHGRDMHTNSGIKHRCTAFVAQGMRCDCPDFALPDESLTDEGHRRREIHALTEPMLTSGVAVEAYAEAARQYNAMAVAYGFAGIPATLHEALYDSRHGEQDIRSAIENLAQMARELAGGLVSLMLACKMRKELK